MSSNPADILDWIKFHYGEPTITRGNGVFVAVVTFDGSVSIAIGMGSSRAQALYDLYCDLTFPDIRPEYTRPPNSRRWERERRTRIDQEFIHVRLRGAKS